LERTGLGFFSKNGYACSYLHGWVADRSPEEVP